MYTSFFYWQGGEFIEFLQNKYLPTLQLAPRLIQVIVSNSFTEQNSIQCQVLSLGDKLLLSQMCLALNAAKQFIADYSDCLASQYGLCFHYLLNLIKWICEFV